MKKILSLDDLRVMPPALSVEECERAMEIADRMAGLSNASPSEAVDLAHRLLGQFRTLDGVGEGFTAALAAQFSLFPRSVGERIVDPLHGLVTKVQFLPSVAELRKALEEEQLRRKSVGYRANYLLGRHRQYAHELSFASQPHVGPERVAELLAGIFKHNVVTPEGPKGA